MSSAVLAAVPTAFWGSIAWFVWGWFGAAIVSIFVGIATILALGLVRSASEIETVDAAPWPHELRRAA